MFYMKILTSNTENTDVSKLHLHWRESHYKGKTYRSYSLAQAYREDGKNKKKIIAKLGKLSEHEANRWKEFLQAMKNPKAIFTTIDDLAVKNRYAYLDVMVINEIWNYWNLNETFPNIETANIARILTINRSIDPMAKSKVTEWFYHTSLQWFLNTDINTNKIFRELNTIEDNKETISNHLYKKYLERNPESMKSVFYDLSSATFSGTHCLLVKWGHCKEGFDNHIVIALVVNKDGLPFYWEVLPGNTSDASTITWLSEQFQKKFNMPTTLIFDRGMVSENNLDLLEENAIKYISAMDKNQIEEITELNFEDIDQSQFTEIDNIRYREIKKDKRYVLVFNPVLKEEQIKLRNQNLSNFEEFMRIQNQELLSAKKSRDYQKTLNKFQQELKRLGLGFLHINISEMQQKVRTYQATFTIDPEKQKYTSRLDGYWLLVTNQNELSTEELIKSYKDKLVIESAFRDIKSFIEISPVYVWTEKHVKAHFTLCVLSYLINKTLTLRLHKHKREMPKDIVFHESLYETLSHCQIDQIVVSNLNIKTFNITTPTNEQKELLDRVEMSLLLDNEGINKIRKLQY